MDQLANAFSILELDVDGDQTMDHAAAASSSSSASLPQSTTNSGKGKKKVDGENQQERVPPSGEYRMPLVWIDLEMTGLDVEVDRIIEIACIITDGKMMKLIEGPELVIHQSKECLDRMGEWCQTHHGDSGLTERVIHSTITEREAELQVLEFVKKHVGTYTPQIAGNSVYMDLIFLRKYMPELASLFSHVIVDVSSVRSLCYRWYPRGITIVISEKASMNSSTTSRPYSKGSPSDVVGQWERPELSIEPHPPFWLINCEESLQYKSRAAFGGVGSQVLTNVYCKLQFVI